MNNNLFSGENKWYWIAAVVIMVLAALFLIYNLGYSFGYLIGKLLK
ncbi:hypothetical protein ORI89_18450 [Sphingobacterium sp. UT-1RO-CII-1]|nr:hypothetical protein [Sphingobacterium sp. UT-1RO-CII-1]MCY4781640.1 hypothetical protein [Sphingobacterium sp. UT-1RO-CII-1]